MSRRGIEVPPRNSTAPVRVPGNSKKKPSGVLNPRHTSAQDPLYQEWIDNGVALELSFDDGTVLQGVLQRYDTYSLQLDSNGAPMLVFKQSLRWIKPA